MIWKTLTNHFKAAGDVTAEHSRFQSLYVSSHVRLRVENVTVFRQLVEHLLLFVREDDVAVECLNHQQGFTQGPGTFPQNLCSTNIKNELVH